MPINVNLENDMLEGGLIGLLAVAVFVLLSNPAQNVISNVARVASYIVIFVTTGVLIGGAITGQLF